MFIRDQYMIRETFNAGTAHRTVMDRHFNTEEEARESFKQLRTLRANAILYGPVDPAMGRRWSLESLGARVVD